jgi:hypothetical protein
VFHPVDLQPDADELPLRVPARTTLQIG